MVNSAIDPSTFLLRSSNSVQFLSCLLMGMKFAKPSRCSSQLYSTCDSPALSRGVVMQTAGCEYKLHSLVVYLIKYSHTGRLQQFKGLVSFNNCYGMVTCFKN